MGSRVSNEVEASRLQSMSRRGFIGGAGTALAVGALAGTVRARTDEAIPGLPRVWDYGPKSLSAALAVQVPWPPRKLLRAV